VYSDNLIESASAAPPCSIQVTVYIIMKSSGKRVHSAFRERYVVLTTRPSFLAQRSGSESACPLGVIRREPGWRDRAEVSPIGSFGWWKKQATARLRFRQARSRS
jgi:hypothetical protein